MPAFSSDFCFFWMWNTGLFSHSEFHWRCVYLVNWLLCSTTWSYVILPLLLCWMGFIVLDPLEWDKRRIWNKNVSCVRFSIFVLSWLVFIWGSENGRVLGGLLKGTPYSQFTTFLFHLSSSTPITPPQTRTFLKLFDKRHHNHWVLSCCHCDNHFLIPRQQG